jgi:hypothetical protein
MPAKRVACLSIDKAGRRCATLKHRRSLGLLVLPTFARPLNSIDGMAQRDVRGSAINGAG